MKLNQIFTKCKQTPALTPERPPNKQCVHVQLKEMPDATLIDVGVKDTAMFLNFSLFTDSFLNLNFKKLSIMIYSQQNNIKNVIENFVKASTIFNRTPIQRH